MQGIEDLGLQMRAKLHTRELFNHKTRYSITKIVVNIRISECAFLCFIIESFNFLALLEEYFILVLEKECIRREDSRTMVQ